MPDVARTPRLPTPAALATTLALALGARTALATSISPDYSGGPHPAGPTPLVIERAELTFDCRARTGSGPRCAYEGRYTVRNPDAAAHTLVAGFVVRFATPPVVRADGASIARPLTDAEADAVGRTAMLAEGQRLAPTDSPSVVRDATLARAGFELAFEPGQTREFVATGTLDPATEFDYNWLDYSAIRARHMLLHRAARAGRHEFAFRFAPTQGWASIGEVTIRVRAPASWSVRARLEPDAPSGERGGRDGRQRRHGAITPEGDARVLILRVPRGGAQRMRVALALPRFPIEHGGPVLGIGGTLSDPSPLRARLGYEFGGPGYLVYSVSAESDLRTRVVVATVIEVATPWILPALFIPSMSVGVGLPVQLAPDVRVGVRAQLAFQWPLVGFVVSFDVYPAAGAATSTLFHPTLLFRLSL